MVRGPDHRPGALATALVTTGAVIAALVGACASPAPSAEPSPSGPVSVVPNGELLLRYECSMGPAVMPPGRACFGPTFSLYSDGTVIFRRAATDSAAEIGLRRYPSYSVAVLTPAATESLHADAVAVLTAVAAKPVPPIDPNAPIVDPAWYDTFTVDLGGRRLVVAPGQGPIPPAHVATPELGPLTRRLEAFAPDGADLASPAGPWVPDRFLTSVGFGSGAPTADWPWPDLTPAGFGASPDGTGRATPRLIRPADAALAGVVDAAGLTDLWVRGPDGTGAYLIFIRALMPDEPGP